MCWYPTINSFAAFAIGLHEVFFYFVDWRMCSDISKLLTLAGIKSVTNDKPSRLYFIFSIRCDSTQIPIY